MWSKERGSGKVIILQSVCISGESKNELCFSIKQNKIFTRYSGVFKSIQVAENFNYFEEHGEYIIVYKEQK